MTPRPQMPPQYHAEDAEMAVPLLITPDMMTESKVWEQELVVKCNVSESYLRFLMSFGAGLGCAFGALVPLTIVGTSALMGYICSSFQIEMDSQKYMALLIVFWNLFVTILVMYARFLYCGVLLGRLQPNGLPRDLLDSVKFLLWRTFSMGILFGMLVPGCLLEISCFFIQTPLCRITSPELTGATMLLTLCVAHCLYCETHSPLPIKDNDVEPEEYEAEITVV